MRKLKIVNKIITGALKPIFKKKFNNPQFHSSYGELDKRLVRNYSRSKLPTWEQLTHIDRLLNRTETWIIRICFGIIAASGLFLSVNFYTSHLQIAPKAGGDYSEGVIGSPKYINPLYSQVNDVDADICSLIFSSLFKYDANGQLIGDLGQMQTVSADGLSYEVAVRLDAKWHNGESVTVDDVLFTFSAIQNKEYESPWRISFFGVQAERKDDKTIRFVLNEPYAAFPDLLTFGILPASLWQDIDPKNVKFADIPVGSGPFAFKSLVKDKKTGTAKSYTLIRNEGFYAQKPWLEKIVFHFFPSQEEAIQALNENEIDGLSFLPRDQRANIIAQNVFNFNSVKFPQEVAIFFNSARNAVLSDKRIRQALAYSLPKQDLIDQVLGRDYRPIDGPLPEDSFAYNSEQKKYGYDKAQAEKLFNEAGWKIFEITDEAYAQAEKNVAAKDELTRNKAEVTMAIGKGKWLKKNEDYLRIVFSTIDKTENAEVAEYLRSKWAEVGVKIELQFLTAANLQAQAIKNRNFEALLYGIISGADPDPYAFWHSSQISRGFNLAGFKNEDVDQMLEVARASSSPEFRTVKYKEFQNVIAEEVPAIFLYSPNYVYTQNNRLKGFDTKKIILPSGRFAGVSGWYVKTGRKLEW